MKIVVVQETDWLKRGPHQQHHLFERLSLRGHVITVLDYPILRPHWPREPLFASRQEHDNAARICPGAEIRLVTPGTTSLNLLARPSSVLAHHAALARLIAADKPDVIVSYALSTGIPALRLARKHHIPFVFHVIDALHAIVPSVLLQPVAKQVEKRIFRKANAVLLINAHLRDYAICMGAAPERAYVLRTGVDLARFHPVPDNDPGRAKVRSELGILPGEIILFFMGWLYRFSGVREICEALENAPANLRLLVVGDGDDYQTLVHLRDARLGDRLILTGRVDYDRIPEFLSAADVLLLPFHTCPATEHIVPIKLYEYMAAGKPVIASPLPGILRDIGENNGVIYAPAEKQVETAMSILRDAGEPGKKARQFVEMHCDWETITVEFEGLLRQVADDFKQGSSDG